MLHARPGFVHSFPLHTLVSCLLQHIVTWLVNRRGLAGSILGVSIGCAAVAVTLVQPIVLRHLSVAPLLAAMGAALLLVNLLPLSVMRLPPAPLGAVNTRGAAPPRLLGYSDMLKTRRVFMAWVVLLGSMLPGWGIVAASTLLFTDVGGVSRTRADRLTSFM